MRTYLHIYMLNFKKKSDSIYVNYSKDTISSLFIYFAFHIPVSYSSFIFQFHIPVSYSSFIFKMSTTQGQLNAGEVPAAQPTPQLDLAYQFYRLTFNGDKTHDLGEIPALYDVYDDEDDEGIFVADFGATDLKFLNNGCEDKFKNKTGKYTPENGYLLNEPGFTTLISELNKRAPTWPKGSKLYFRAGSIIKKGGDIIAAKIQKLISKFNKQKGKHNIEEKLVVENSVIDTIGRLNKPTACIMKVGDKTNTPVTELSPGNIVLLGGPLTYGLPIIKFTPSEMIYTEFDRKTKTASHKCANFDSKMPFKFFYYHQAFFLLMSRGKINLDTDIILMGPTGSNPTISVVNTNRGLIHVYEFVGQNFDETAENGGYKEVNLRQVKVTNVPITPEEQPILCKLLS